MKDPYILLASIEKTEQQINKHLCCIADNSKLTSDAIVAVAAAADASASGKTSLKRIVSAASTNTGYAKASEAELYSIYAINLNAAVRYLKIYNKASAPVLANDTPIATYAIPGNTAGAGFTIQLNGALFSTGLAYAITTGVADTNTGATAANEIFVVLEYK